MNLYAYWVRQQYRLVHTDVPYPTENAFINIAPNFVYDLRIRERKRIDRHAAPLDEGQRWMAVERYHRHVFFTALQNRRIYASPDMARSAELCAVVEHLPLICWVWASRPNLGEDVADFLFRIWEALLEGLDRLSTLLLEQQPAWSAPVHIRLNLRNPDAWREFRTSAGDSPPERPGTSIDLQRRWIGVDLPFGFLSLVRRSTNDGERALLEEVAAGLLALELGEELDQMRQPAERLVSVCLGGPDRRSVHLFQANRPTDYLGIPGHPYPWLIQPEDVAYRSLGLAWRAVQRVGPAVITGVQSGTDALNRLVDALWNDIREQLEALNAESLIGLALLNNEAIFRDRELWRRTARAVFALQEGNEDVARIASSREAERALASLAGRVLVEMAVPTCPRSGGRSVSWSDYDELSAGVGTLINLASDSDAIRGGVATAELQVLANGEVIRDHSFLAEVANPYVVESFRATYRSAAAEYDLLYHVKSDGDASADPLQDEEFGAAFTEEYGLSPSDVIDGAAELLDLAHEGGGERGAPLDAW